MVRFSIPAVNVRKHAWVCIFFLYSEDKCTKSAAASVVLGEKPGPTALVSETFEQIQKLRNFLKTYIYLCVSLLSSFENIDDN